jgi:deazaflavin-dependent oxidoreductase (nitroreductase family)
MSTIPRSGGIVWRIMRWLNPHLLGRFRSGGKPGQLVLLLTTSGRKTGADHLTPLQYELVGEAYYVGSARGRSADWYCNILSNPEVKIEINGEVFSAHAEAITDPKKIAEFIELRLSRHPRMIGTMLRLEGLPARYSRRELEEFASKKALVILHPSKEVDIPQASIQ